MKYTKSAVLSVLQNKLENLKAEEEQAFQEATTKWDRESSKIGGNRKEMIRVVTVLREGIAADDWTQVASTWSEAKYSMGQLSSKPAPVKVTRGSEELQRLIDMISTGSEDEVSTSELERMGLLRHLRFQYR